MLSEINQTEKEKYCLISHVESKKQQQTKFIGIENRLVVARGGRVDRWWVKWVESKVTNFQLQNK